MSDKQTEKTIQLDTPIKRGKTEITEIVLRKPQSGALRGTRLQAIMDMDVNAMMTVIPRISSPALTAQEIAEMDPADLTAMSVEVSVFNLTLSKGVMKVTSQKMSDFLIDFYSSNYEPHRIGVKNYVEAVNPGQAKLFKL